LDVRISRKALQNLAGEILRQFEKRLATITVVLLPFLASFSEGSAKFDRKKYRAKIAMTSFVHNTFFSVSAP